MQRGKLIISLDFELNWGVFEKKLLPEHAYIFENTLQIIPKILNMFKQHDISATWATVGFLFFDNLTELQNNLPELLPNYVNPQISSYRYISDSFRPEYNSYHFAKDIIQLIQKTPGQEIASHTLSHYYCMEKGQNPETFKADIQKNIEIAQKNGLKLKSLVFPRNQYNNQYEKILSELGITNIRTNPDIWFWNSNYKETLLKKIFRTVDAYLPLFNGTYDTPDNNSFVIKIKASRFFRPTSKQNILNKLKIRRIKKEMLYAAQHNKIYHLWWHPHNFAHNPKQSLTELEKILKHYNFLQQNYNFQSLNMKDLAEQIKNTQ